MGKYLLRRTPRVLYGHFDPYVFNFNLETEAVQIRSISIRVDPRGHDVKRK